MIIAIDGPSGVGKSSIAKAISKKLNIYHLDTGAMYRTLAYKLKKDNIEFSKELLKDFDFQIKDNKFYLDNEDITDKIRENDISILASNISKIKEVREFMVELQRKISNNKDVVLDGRDIATVVFPNADIKLYIDASAEIRAKRRFLELNETISFDKILEDIKNRDYQDMTREIAPLVKADDAILVDTSNMSLEEVIKKIIDIIEGEQK
ncbi:(d)CMP kinase [Oceanivirga miroungae]|uniref:Cytidylate kinase n=1 Tax=Oceanivirga miroungae TaxID=1130046 RepID=A0A6I8M6X7_9FUSO|nr:(d)CMP kinase [Oceanivirga miroungae]VWL85155.1 cytidylate kinase [Oceanivirga miroungae]